MQGNTTMPTVRKRFDDRTSSPGMKSGYLFKLITNLNLFTNFLFFFKNKVHLKVA